MGGSIGFTIREKNGTEHRMCRWTNSMPGFINHIDFIEESDEHLQNYLKVYLDMKEDWEKHGEDWDAEGRDYGIFEHHMTPVYAPFNGILAPIEYGLVVVDYQTNTVLHCQGYTSFGSIYGMEFFSSFAKNKPWEYIGGGWEEITRDNQRLIDSGKIKSFMTYDRETYDEIHTPITDIDKQMAPYVKVMESRRRRKRKEVPEKVILDMNPWKVIRFKEGKEGFDKFREEVTKLGFVLNEKDREEWDLYINSHYSEDESEWK